MISGKSFVFFVVAVGLTLAYAPGEYIPKSFYLIDQFGHESAPIYIRNRREIFNPSIRMKRGNSYASSSASSSASSGGGSPIYYGDYVPNVEHPSDIIGHVQSLLDNIPVGGAGGSGTQSFASSSSSSNAGNGGGPAPGESYGGAGHNSGYNGPTLFSRFGEAQGDGVQVSGAAQGKNGAFSSSSSSIDGNGKIKYSVQSGKY